MKFYDYLDGLETDQRHVQAHDFDSLREHLPDEAEAYEPLFSDEDTLALMRSGLASQCLRERERAGDFFPIRNEGRISGDTVRFGVHWHENPGGIEPRILMKYRDESGEDHGYELGKAHLHAWYAAGKLSAEQLAIIEQCADNKHYDISTSTD